MTTQIPEVLLREIGAPELPHLQLFGVKVDDIDSVLGSEEHPSLKAGEPGSLDMCSALWRGYIATLQLKADGSIVLMKFDYLFGRQPKTVNKPLDGDFWLDLRESYESNGLRVPFRKGQLIEDTGEWRTWDGRRLSTRS